MKVEQQTFQLSSKATIGAALLLLVAVGLGLACRPQRLHLRLAEFTQPAGALHFIALEEGFYEAEGLDLQIKSFVIGKDALDSMLSGQADIATVYDTPFLNRALSGTPLIAITALHRSTENTGLLARRDRGIRSAEDLRGKKVGVTSRTNADFFLSSFLLDQGVDPKTVQKVELEPPHHIQAIATGEVDAIAVWQPLLNQAFQALGANNSTVLYSDTYSEMSLVACTPSTLAKKAELQAFLRALSRADDLINSDEPRAIRAFEQGMAKRGHLDAKSIWNRFHFALQMNHLLVVLLQQQVDWMQEFNKAIPATAPDLHKLLDTAILESVKPEAVTLISSEENPK